MFQFCTSVRRSCTCTRFSSLLQTELQHETFPDCFFVWFFVAVLSKLVTSLKEADSLSSDQELNFLQNLLESKEINALVNVHSKVGKVCKDEKCAPLMSSSIQVNPSASFICHMLRETVERSSQHFNALSPY